MASTPEKLPLTVAVIALNAETQVGELLASVGFADEVLVVDSGSTDATVRLAGDGGARVIHQDWLGYGRQKQFAVTAARND